MCRTGLHATVEHRVCGVHVARNIGGVHGVDGGDGELPERSWSIEREASLESVSALHFPRLNGKVCVTNVVDEDVNPAEFLDG